MHNSNSNPRIGLIPGYGARCRIFERIVWPEGWDIVPLEWPEPLSGESLESYVHRWRSEMPECIEVLVGVSWGGVLALHLGPLVHSQHIVQISSWQQSKHQIWWLRALGKGALHRLVVLALRWKTPKQWAQWWGPHPVRVEQLWQKWMLPSDAYLFRWALPHILKNAPPQVTIPITALKGTRDAWFPLQPHEIPIEGATHVAVITHAAAISLHLTKILKKTTLTTSDQVSL